MAGLYIHIPYCKVACIYCDFHFSTNHKTRADLVKALCTEIELRKNYMEDELIETVYFGGGTPSVLEQSELNDLMTVIYKNYRVNPEAEITLEANPEDLSAEKLSVLRQLGINRLSIGIQSFNDEELKWMNRIHSSEQSINCIREAQQAGFNNISIDLIYGSRFQSLDSWKKTLEKTEELNVQHLSCYSLTVEDKTELGLKVKRKQEPGINDELTGNQFEYLMDWSKRSGFEQYEVSNFAKKGFYSRHNSSYWEGKKYAGFGPGAHSFNGLSRQWNVSNNPSYIKTVSEGGVFWEVEELDEQMKLNEYLLTSLRTSKGLDMEFIRKNFDEKYHFYIEKGLKIEAAKGNLMVSGNNATLTSQGLFLADEITRHLMV